VKWRDTFLLPTDHRLVLGLAEQGSTYSCYLFDYYGSPLFFCQNLKNRSAAAFEGSAQARFIEEMVSQKMQGGVLFPEELRGEDMVNRCAEMLEENNK